MWTQGAIGIKDENGRMVTRKRAGSESTTAEFPS